ncbi:MAG: phosphoribosylglycinamide synthetase C domain-containing protein, partial [Ferruginibacter sp.]|nr:phosphoribosylglycinamide synthetase C domain-containing protein [Ferruginibacter sp.]
IHGLEEAALEGTIIFHSGTKEDGGKVLSNGGRVLAITSFGDTIKDAGDQSNYTLEQVFFEGIYFRDDIGFEFR